jgi:hypothetical protein
MTKLNDIDYLYSQALDNKPHYGGYANNLSFRDKRIKFFLNQLIETNMDDTETWCLTQPLAGMVASRLSIWLDNGVMGYPNNLTYNQWLTILTKMRDGFTLIYEDNRDLWDYNSPEALLAEEVTILLGQYFFHLWD